MKFLQHLYDSPEWGEVILPVVLNFGQYLQDLLLQYLSFSVLPDWPALIDGVIVSLE